MANEYEYCCEQLAKLTARVEVLDHQLSDIKDHQKMVLEDLSRLVTRHDYILIGHNGEAGMVMEVDRLKQVNVSDRLKSLELTITRWGGAIGVATIVFPILIKLLWP